MSTTPVRAAADALASRLHAVGAPTALAVIGPRGSGKTGVLDTIAGTVDASGRRRVLRMRAAHSTQPASPSDPAGAALADAGPTDLLLVDDAHWLDDDVLARLVDGQRGDDRATVVLSWADRGPVRPVLARWTELAARQDAAVTLGPLHDQELFSGLAQLLGAPADSALAEWLRVQTGGHPAHVAALTAGLVADAQVVRGRFVEGPPPRGYVPENLARLVMAVLDQEHPDCRLALATLTAVNSVGMAGELAVARPEPWATLVSVGLARNGQVLTPVVSDTVASALAPVELARASTLAAELAEAAGASVVEVARLMWAGRAQGPASVTAFAAAGAAVVDQDPVMAATWFERAARREDPARRRPLRARRSEALVAAGQLVEGVELAERLLAEDTDPDAGGTPHAAAALASAYASRGRWADVARWTAGVRDHSLLDDGFWAWSSVAALALNGSLPDAAARAAELAAARPPAADQPVVAQLAEATVALLDSTAGERARLERARAAVRELVALGPLLRAPVVAPVPIAELTAAVAAALGDPVAARRLVSTLPDRGARRRRVAALRRWTALRCGEQLRPEDADTGAERAGAGDPAARGPDEGPDLVELAVEAALARRSGDVAGCGALARRIPRLVAGLQLDLAEVDPAAELFVIAHRYSPAAVTEELGATVATLLDRAGRPPLWSTRWHWACLEAAVAAGDVEGVAGPADELAGIARLAIGATVLAEAAAVWRDLLSGRTDAEQVDAAVSALRASGLVWEAAQLAGQAAIRVDDAELAKSLLGRARSLRGGVQGGKTGAENDKAVTPGGLSEREAEVAKLVLDGLTHKSIGATLFISPKTVEHHVAHIRQKLGATNRAEFLAALREDLAASVDT